MIKEKESIILKRNKGGLLLKLGAGFLGFATIFLNLECMTANMLPFRPRVEDISFSNYQETVKRQFGERYLANVMAELTYPGAWLGATIHNYGLPPMENPQH